MMSRYILIALFLGALFSACDNEDFENPLDARNVRTLGAPGDVVLSPDDGRVTIRWTETGLPGIEAYQIFRRYTLSEEDFPPEPIAVVPADLGAGQSYEFIDDNNGEGLESDKAAYVYRLSHVAEGQIIPDPTHPPENWPSYAVTPSAPPPLLQLGQPITLGDPRDLELTFFWADYQPPLDISAFRVYTGDVGVDPQNMELDKEISVDAQFPNPTEWFFTDRFEKDGVTRIYRIVAVDLAGVESGSPVFEATSPNLPPPAPSQVVGPPIQHLFSDRYDIRMRWQASVQGGREVPDLVGYRIYSTHYDTSNERLIWRKRKTLARNVFAYEFQSEDPIAFEGNLYYRDYYIVAYDDTPREDGSDDESPLPPLPELVPPTGP